jgi:hypothetical protein
LNRQVLVARTASRFTFHVSRLALLALASLFVVALVAMPPEGLTHHDTGAKYLQVRNFRITPQGLDWSINYPARPLDPQLEFVPFHPRQHYVDGQGRIYLQWPIFLGLLTRIPWKVMGFWGLYVVPLLAGLGAAWASWKLALALGVHGKVSWLAIPLVGLATPVAFYSLVYFEHTLAALLVTLSLLASVLAMQARARRVWFIALSGVFLAAALYFRSELYILAVVMALGWGYLAWRGRSWRPLVVWGAAFALALVPLWGFYFLTEGSLLPLHATPYFSGSYNPEGNGTAGVELPQLRYIATAGWGTVPDFLFGPETFPSSPIYPAWIEIAGLLGVALLIVAAFMGLLRSRDAMLPWRMGALVVGLGLLLITAGWVLLSPQPYHNLHGFLLAAPFAALALWPPPRSENGETTPQGWLYAVVLLYVGLHALMISALSGLGPISRHEWGQRYLLPAYPALVAMALVTVSRLWRVYANDGRTRRLALAGLALWGALVLVGLGFSVRGYTVLREERAQVAGWLDLAGTLPGRTPLVTDEWWMSLNLAADFYTRPMMLADGEERLAEWARQMRERGVTSFGLITPNQTLLDGAWRGGVPGLQASGPLRESGGLWLQEFTFNQ